MGRTSTDDASRYKEESSARRSTKTSAGRTNIDLTTTNDSLTSDRGARRKGKSATTGRVKADASKGRLPTKSRKTDQSGGTRPQEMLSSEDDDDDDEEDYTDSSISEDVAPLNSKSKDGKKDRSRRKAPTEDGRVQSSDHSSDEYDEESMSSSNDTSDDDVGGSKNRRRKEVDKRPSSKHSRNWSKSKDRRSSTESETLIGRHRSRGESRHDDKHSSHRHSHRRKGTSGARHRRHRRYSSSSSASDDSSVTSLMSSDRHRSRHHTSHRPKPPPSAKYNENYSHYPSDYSANVNWAGLNRDDPTLTSNTSYNPSRPPFVPNYASPNYSYSQSRFQSDQNYSTNRDFDFSSFKPPEWNGDVIPFRKNFYKEAPWTAQLTPEQVKTIREDNNIEIIEGEDVPKPVASFAVSGFSAIIVQALQKSYKVPTAIQIQGWPIALSGRDIIGIAETGSGKTLAFMLPALLHVRAQLDECTDGGPIALVMSPTRELCIQILESSQQYLDLCQISGLAIYGQSGPPALQAEQLKSGQVHILVACPGRLFDLMHRFRVELRRVTYFVLDEADKLLDQGFGPQIVTVAECIRKDRQTLMWSATWPYAVQDLARSVFVGCNPIRIHIGVSGGLEYRVPKTIQVVFCYVDNEIDRWEAFKDFVRDKPTQRILVFTDTKRECNEIVRDLNQEMPHLKAGAMHGDKTQGERNEMLKDYRNGLTNILVGTDLLSRGLDIPNIVSVVLYRVRMVQEDFVHRVGRTGRAGADGNAFVLVDPGQKFFVQDLMRLIDCSSEKNYRR